ncbi:hypothetical protein [uncultured Senegalimassilia sp.]|uniref:hypothetical protein n=1 Tax=uncultured Senegalimassilia sp. TaxID=1714350 RepID=UPI0027DC1936|nr:hypothetical protein [uncultured Senegalimassilia sp.]
MISNEERKIVAANLRQYLKKYETPDWRAFCNIILGSGRLDNLRKAQAFDRLADLIDRPTAKQEHNGAYWRCSHCGAFTRKDAVVMDGLGVVPLRCCGNCGREWDS